MTVYAHAFRDLARVKPADRACGCGVFAGPGSGDHQVGQAYPASHVGGWRGDFADIDDYPPPEQTWRLVLHREVVDGRAVPLEKKQDLGDRWVLRLGEFVELAEDAMRRSSAAARPTGGPSRPHDFAVRVICV